MEYVNNKEFLAQMIEYKQKIKEADECGEEHPRINNYIGKCIYDIANNLSHKPNFINYPFREEMIGDGIENAIKCLANFDPEKSNNPFAYFTQVIYFAFIRRIQKEKKNLYVKHKLLENTIINNSFYSEGEGSDVSDEFLTKLNTSDYMQDFVKTYEEGLESKKVASKKPKKGLEKFYEEEVEDEDSDSN